MKNRQIVKKTAHRLTGKRVRNRFANRSTVFISHNFSDVEDKKNAFEIIGKLANDAGMKALAEAKAAGLPRMFVRNNQLIKITADGKETSVKPLHTTASGYYVSINEASV